VRNHLGHFRFFQYPDFIDQSKDNDNRNCSQKQHSNQISAICRQQTQPTRTKTATGQKQGAEEKKKGKKKRAAPKGRPKGSTV